MGSDSGPGSNLDVTDNVRKSIVELLSSPQGSKITRIVDVPCGDMTWMETLLPFLEKASVSYLGMDVVQVRVN